MTSAFMLGANSLRENLRTMYRAQHPDWTTDELDAALAREAAIIDGAAALTLKRATAAGRMDKHGRVRMSARELLSPHPSFIDGLPSDFAQAATEYDYGPRCPDFDPDCACCAAWAHFDRTGESLIPAGLAAYVAWLRAN